MTYHLEMLGDERFQQLCQALLVKSFPKTQCFPVGQPDGGRDGLTPGAEDKGFIVFQIKYVKDPLNKKSRDLVEQVIASEKEKVQKLIKKGAKAYYLLTNVAGTSHLDSGSIDKTQKYLTDNLGLDSQCWWRDDLNRRIDGSEDIKWSYTEILKGSDVLKVLVNKNDSAEDSRRIRTMRAYMRHQATYDSQLKFKQIELHNNILDLFVDTPASLAPVRGEKGLSRWIFVNKRWTKQLVKNTHDVGDTREETNRGGLEFLINEEFVKQFPKIILEGAPGQGKSTLSQYLCQLHRMVLLDLETDLNKVPNYPKQTRLPFKADLRDYASWLNNKNPFNDDPAATLPAGSTHRLESFLSAQVHENTGGEFSVNDLRTLSETCPLLIVLDGFDEVADVHLRNKIVEEVSNASKRFEVNKFPTQIIVTSRPAAFANSPGFSPSEWPHLSLKALSLEATEKYAEKWLDARNVDLKEKKEVLNLLKEKVKQPHIRELSRNPMQLAILLSLILVRGSSLPSKRTELYDNYIDIFLNRESEKNAVVRDHRDLLVQIHQYLAWILQVEAETKQGTGSIAEGRLRSLLKEYLNDNGYELSLVDDLFTGMVERVVALVSRVQGTFEFEVQPLREYFAARYLHDTAPYSPPGAPKSGTRPQRFAAIAKNFYWLNVTRFYSGCYTVGELSSLLDGLEEIENNENYKYLFHSRFLAITLLTDFVFNQNPKLAEKLATKITQALPLRIFLANYYLSSSDHEIGSLPNPAKQVVRKATQNLLESSNSSDTLMIAAQIFAKNSTQEEKVIYWKELRAKRANDSLWAKIGNYMGIFSSLSREDLKVFLQNDELNNLGDFLRSRLPLNLNDAISGLPKHINDLLDTNGSYYSYYNRNAPAPEQAFKPIILLSVLLSSYFYRNINRISKKISLQHYISRTIDFDINGVTLADLSEMSPLFKNKKAKRFLQATETLLRSQDSGQVELACESLIEAGVDAFGSRWGMYRMAISLAHNSDYKDGANYDFSSQETLFKKALSARKNATQKNWWSQQFKILPKNDALALRFYFLALFSWVPANIIIGLDKEIQGQIDSLTQSEWGILSEAVVEIRNSHSYNKPPPKNFLKASDLPKFISQRIASLLMVGANKVTAKMLYTRYLQGYSGQDKHILERIMDFMEDVSGSEKSWENSLPAISHAYSNSVIYPGAYDYGGYDQSIPLGIAKKICADSYKYPLGLVGKSEQTLAAHAGELAVRVGDAADREKWFNN